MSSETAIVETTVITKEHKSIAEKFVDQIVGALNNGPHKIRNYSVQSGYSETESVDLEIDANTRLCIQLSRSNI